MSDLYKLIETAKDDSKNKIIKFFKGMYNIDEDTIGHLFDVPIFSSYEDDKIIKTTLKSKSEDDILDILDEEIQLKLGDSEAAFMNLEEISGNEKFSDEDIAEYKEKVAKGEIQEDYDSIIVYNPSKFKTMYKELIEKNKKNFRNPKTQEELDEMFIKKCSQIFTHERAHINVDVLEKNSDSIITNGANASINELDNFIDSSDNDDYNEKDEKEELRKKYRGNYLPKSLISINKEKYKHDLYDDYSENTNEILLEIFSEIITNYNYGDKIEDKLYDIIKQKGNKPLLEDINDTQEFLIYSVFPEELTKWLALGAYSDERKNLYKELESTILCKEKGFRISNSIIKDKVGNYCNANKNLSHKQVEMLEMLGVKNLEKKITIESIKNIANSDEVMLNIAENEDSIVNKLNEEQKKELV